MRNAYHCIIGILAILATASIASAQVYEGTDAEQHLKALKIQAMMLEQQSGQLKTEAAGLAQVQSAQEATDAQLKTAISAYKADVSRYNDVIAREKAVAADHNARCVGTFSDRTYVRDCNQKAADINTWKANLDSQKAGLDSRKASILAQVGELTAAWKDRYAKQQRNAQASQDLETKKAELAADISKTVDLILLQRQAGNSCDASGIENFEKNLNGAAERAHRCLSRDWDGAR